VGLSLVSTDPSCYGKPRPETITSGAIQHVTMSAGDEAIARERIQRLADLARNGTKAGHPERAREYVRRARRIAERHRLSLPKRFKRFTCDACDAYLVPGRNARVRTRDGHVVVTCDCGAQARYPYE
jgi:ribonuclease P protein subunit RPR2